jgi:lipopolysaccharide export system permease protein
MRLLDRYLLRELLLPLGYCLGGFLIFWVAFDLFNEMQDFQKARLKGWEVAEYYLVKTPELLVTVLPIALLLALLYALTNHARHNELTAMRAAGVGLWRLSAPYLGVGLVFSLMIFAINERLVPQVSEMAADLKNRHERAPDGAAGKPWRQQLSFHNARDNRYWFIQSYNTDTGEMLAPRVMWILPDGGRREIAAARGWRTNDAWLFVEVQEITYPPAAPGGVLDPANLPRPSQTNELLLAEFTETPEQIKSEIRFSGMTERQAARRVQLSIEECLNYLRLHPRLNDRDYALLHTQLHGRLAAPWTCLVVVLIALPFGAASGRRNVFVGVASSVFLCFAYFILLRLGLALGTGGKIPPSLAAWLPNLLFGGAGIWLTNRVR